MSINFLRTARLAVVCAALGAAALVAGCNPPTKSQVSGTVTVDGKPLDNGTIEFEPVSGKGQTAGGGVKDGAFQVTAGVGEMKVKVSGSKVVGKVKLYDTPDSPYRDDVRELLPEKYNLKSELTVTLTPGANDGVNFDLKTK